MKTVVVATWLLGHLQAMPYSHAPEETPDQHHELDVALSTALAEEATPYATGQGWSSTELSAAGTILIDEESRRDRRVLAGEKHPHWTQDHGLSRCGFQLRASGLVPQDVWAKLPGTDTDSLHLCVKYGLRVLVAEARQCGVWNGFSANRERVARAFMAYASGGNCKPTEAMWARADKWVKLMADRPDRSPVKGYRRAAPNDITGGMKVFATDLKSKLGKVPELVPGKVVRSGSEQYVAVIERHAEGKLGVSVLVKE